MSTPLILVDELCALASRVLKDTVLEVESKDVEVRTPKIIPGFLDEDKPQIGKPPDDVSESVPFAIVRFLNSDDAEKQGTATIKFIVTTYSKHGQGWRDPLNVLERLRQAILQKRIIAGRFEIQFPIKIESPEERPWPYWVAWMTTTWSIGRPILTEYEEGIYGEGSP